MMETTIFPVRGQVGSRREQARAGFGERSTVGEYGSARGSAQVNTALQVGLGWSGDRHQDHVGDHDDEWVEAVARLYEHVAARTDADDGLSAAESVLALISEALDAGHFATVAAGDDYRHSPIDLLGMISQAMEAGYLTALADVRAGRVELPPAS